MTDENGKNVINKEHTGLDVQLPGRTGVASMCTCGKEWPPLLIIQGKVKFDISTDLTLRITAHWYVTPYNLVAVQYFRKNRAVLKPSGAFCIAHVSVLNMGAVYFSEMLVLFYHTTRRHILQVNNILI